MKSKKQYALGIVLIIFLAACKAPNLGRQAVNKTIPSNYTDSLLNSTSEILTWKEFYNDPFLRALIDSALANNQELNIIKQEISMSQNEIMSKKGELLPTMNAQIGAGVDKAGRYTTQGALEATTELAPGVEMPEPVPDFKLGVRASWEVDIWRQLRNGRDASIKRYLASSAGKNLMVTNLVAEMAEYYYDLLAYDNQLEIVENTIEIQKNALEIVNYQKESSRVTELAVKRFEAEVYKTKSIQFLIQQKIVETENKINFLVGRFPQHVNRTETEIISIPIPSIKEGIPSQLLENRPDIIQAEKELEACHLDIKIAKAEFYPKLQISSEIGINAVNPSYIIRPQSIIYNAAGELIAPLLNRKAIKAKYYNANSKQVQAMFSYESTLLNAYIEVVNQLSAIKNLSESYAQKEKQVEALTVSTQISIDLFSSARADYLEVLMTQREVLEAKFDLVDTKKEQMIAIINAYRALGGGWK